MDVLVEIVGNTFIIMIAIIFMLCIMGLGIMLLLWIVKALTKLIGDMFGDWEA